MPPPPSQSLPICTVDTLEGPADANTTGTTISPLRSDHRAPYRRPRCPLLPHCHSLYALQTL